MTANPPATDLDAERAVIGTVLAYPYLWAQATELSAEDFFYPAHKSVWEALGWSVAEGQAPSQELAAQRLSELGTLSRLEGGAAYLSRCASEFGTLVSFDWQVSRVQAAARRRRVRAALARAVHEVDDPESDVDAMAEELRGALSRNAGPSSWSTFADLASGIKDDIEGRAQRHKDGSGPGGAPTGISWLDSLTNGFQDGWLVVIAAETAGGKTALAMQTLVNVALGGGSGLAVNLEMTKADLAERALVHVARINSQNVRRGEVDGCWSALTEAERKLAAAKIAFEDRASTMPKICAAFRSWRARYPGKAIGVVDFIQLIRSPHQKGTSRAQEIGGYAQDLKALAKELSMPIIALSQLNRSGVKADRPSKADLKESGDIENAADLILIIWNKAKVSEGEVTFIVDKFRHGQKMENTAHWVGKHYRYGDAE